MNFKVLVLAITIWVFLFLFNAVPRQNLNHIHWARFFIKNWAFIVCGDWNILSIIFFKDGLLGWGLLKSLFAQAPGKLFLVDNITTEELVHLVIAVQAFWLASFTRLGEDEDLVWYQIKQTQELILLERHHFESHEYAALGFPVRIYDYLYGKEKESHRCEGCVGIVPSFFPTYDGFAGSTSYHKNQADCNVWQVIYCQKVSCDDI